ncbi:MAG: type II secretion system F family protein [Planctomycetota bacterium]|nr:type II secretion system F family protein [Planctomycetota bacterium]
MNLVILLAVIPAVAAILLVVNRRVSPVEGPSRQGISGLPDAFVRLIRRAGFRPDLVGWRFSLAIVLAGFSGGVVGFIGSRVLAERPQFILIAMGLGVLVGAWIPLAWLRERARQRTRTLDLDFAYMLELLQLSLLGGQGLTAAWTIVTEAVEEGLPELASEMRAVRFEITIGRGWGEAFEATAERSGCGNFAFLGRLLEQSERFGTDLAQAIGAHADSIRHEELQAIEERANRESVRILFPMVLLLLPATLLLMIGPLTLMLLEALAGVDSN